MLRGYIIDVYLMLKPGKCVESIKDKRAILRIIANTIVSDKASVIDLVMFL